MLLIHVEFMIHQNPLKTSVVLVPTQLLPPMLTLLSVRVDSCFSFQRAAPYFRRCFLNFVWLALAPFSKLSKILFSSGPVLQNIGNLSQLYAISKHDLVILVSKQ